MFILRANVRKSGPYLAKYLAKGFDRGLTQGQRRYGSSRDVKLGYAPGEKRGTWVLVKTGLEVLYRRVETALPPVPS